MIKTKVELARKNNVPIGYGVMEWGGKTLEEAIFETCNENNTKYLFSTIAYEYEEYTDGRFIKSGPWYGGGNKEYKLSHEYFAGCELQSEKIRQPWKFGDYVRYAIIYHEEI